MLIVLWLLLLPKEPYGVFGSQGIIYFSKMELLEYRFLVSLYLV